MEKENVGSKIFILLPLVVECFRPISEGSLIAIRVSRPRTLRDRCDIQSSEGHHHVTTRFVDSEWSEARM